MSSTKLLNESGSGYEIRVKDHFDNCWYAWFDGWSITNLEGGIVLMRHPCIDQSGLHGALNKIRDLNLTLVSIVRLPV